MTHSAAPTGSTTCRVQVSSGLAAVLATLLVLLSASALDDVGSHVVFGLAGGSGQVRTGLSTASAEAPPSPEAADAETRVRVSTAAGGTRGGSETAIDAGLDPDRTLSYDQAVSGWLVAPRQLDNLADACRVNSFVPGTLVLMADGTTKPIEDIDIGDWVWATDPETGEAGPRRVTDTIVGDGTKHLVDIEIDGTTITATDGHPFWVDDQGAWVDADDLAPGDLLVLADGTTVDVDAVAERTGIPTVHNLTVDGIHTYHVMAGDDPVLVHNCNITNKIRGQMADRGWTEDLIRDVHASPDFTHPTWHLAADQPATAYARGDNFYVVINDVTGEVVQVSDRFDSAWRPVWNDPRFDPR